MDMVSSPWGQCILKLKAFLSMDRTDWLHNQNGSIHNNPAIEIATKILF